MVIYCVTLLYLHYGFGKGSSVGAFGTRRWQAYLRLAMLVIDEVVYIQLDHLEAKLLFLLISERYEHDNIISNSILMIERSSSATIS